MARESCLLKVMIMKENLLQIAEYIESLEQRLAALEERVADQAEQLDDYKQRIIELESRPIPEDEDEEEFEMDWVEEEPEAEEPEAEEPVVEEPVVEEPASAEPEKVEPAPVEPEAEPVVEEKPETRNLKPETTAKPAPAPQQTTLFGNSVDDLKHAISLGDRFLFQRELFSQNGELMQKTIEALNKQPHFDAAVAYLDKRFGNWDKDSSAYTLFINALHRRFG